MDEAKALYEWEYAKQLLYTQMVKDKVADVVHDTERAIADRSNLVHMGTVVAIGRAEAVVVETGMDTELGHIAGLLQGVEDDQTPLQRRLDHQGAHRQPADDAISGNQG